MSNIPAARDQIELALDIVEHDRNVADQVCLKHNLDLAKTFLEQALRNMTRKPAVRKARKKSVVITEAVRKHIHKLAEDPNMTMQEIATNSGVRSSGRVSEVLNGLR